MAVCRARRLPHLTLTLDLPDTSNCRLRSPLLPPLPPPLPPPATATEYRLSDFEKLLVLGHGNGGTVYKVRHRRTADIYALKLLHHASREPDILRKTDSPEVVRCHAVLPTASGDSALLLEHMDAGSLDALRLPLPEPALAAVARQALLGLAYLHANYIVHRDIKPSNLLVNTSGDVKIADFGAGRIVRRSLRKVASFVGTCAYMSPERFDPAAHGGSYDAYAADVWSLGLTLLELRLGHFPLLPPWERPDWASLICAICVGDPPEIPQGSASDEFRNFIGCCLQKDSGKRWSAAKLLGHPFVAGADGPDSKRALKELLTHS